MTAWVCALCVLGATVLGFRHLTGRARHSVAIGALTLIGVGTGFLAYREYQLESTLAKAIEPITGAGRRVECKGYISSEFTASRNLGEVPYTPGGVGDVAYLRGSVCRQLREYIGSSKESPSIEQVIAVHVLTHEAVHLSGLKSESATECRAMELDADVAEALGASAAEAEALAARYRAEVYPRMPAPYRSDSCASS